MANNFLNLNLCYLSIDFSQFINGLKWWMDSIFPHIICGFITIVFCVLALKLIVWILFTDLKNLCPTNHKMEIENGQTKRIIIIHRN